MKAAALGFLTIAGLVIAAVAAPVERPEPAVKLSIPLAAGANQELIAVSAVVGERLQQVTVIDSKQRVMSVYHIDLASGKVALRSVRNIHFDLQMTEFNGEHPLPREIQSLLESR